jgi:threonine dehydratase
VRSVSADRIAAAAAAIDPAFTGTPLLRGSALDGALGVELALKVETLNPIRSFKGRGTELFAAELVAGRTAAGAAPPHLVCASAGNFGQGLARAGVRRGLRVTVFAAEGANPLKVAAMRAFGAEVRLGGGDFDAAKDRARRHAADAGGLYVEDGAWPEIAEGAGTLALELTGAAGGDAPDAVLLPLGNGALATAWGRGSAAPRRRPAWSAWSPPARRRCACRSPPGGPSRRRPPTPSPTASPSASRCPTRSAPWPSWSTRWSPSTTPRSCGRCGWCTSTRASWWSRPAPPGSRRCWPTARAARWRGARVATPLCGGNVTPEQARAWLCA